MKKIIWSILGSIVAMLIIFSTLLSKGNPLCPYTANIILLNYGATVAVENIAQPGLVEFSVSPTTAGPLAQSFRIPGSQEVKDVAAWLMKQFGAEPVGGNATTIAMRVDLHNAPKGMCGPHDPTSFTPQSKRPNSPNQAIRVGSGIFAAFLLMWAVVALWGSKPKNIPVFGR